MLYIPAEIVAKVVSNFGNTRTKFTDYKENRRALYSCMLVNRMWFEQAAPVLWQDGAGMNVLPMIKRRQYYADKVKNLYVCPRAVSLVQKHGVTFDQVRKLSMLTNDVLFSDLCLFFTKNVKKLTIICRGGRDDGLNNTFLECLMTNSPCLEELRISGTIPFEFDKATFIRALTQLPLVKLWILLQNGGEESNYSIDWQVLGPLLDSSTLQILSIGKIEPHSVLRSIETGSVGNIKQLQCEVHTKDDLFYLTRFLPRIESLRFAFCSPEGEDATGIVPSIAKHCPDLTCLRFSIHQGSNAFSFREVSDACSSLTKLEELEIKASDTFDEYNGGFAISISESLPQLRVFKIQGLWQDMQPKSFAWQTIETIGCNCRHLEVLELGMVLRIPFQPTFDYGNKVLFPKLKYLLPEPRTQVKDEFREFAKQHIPNFVPAEVRFQDIAVARFFEMF